MRIYYVADNHRKKRIKIEFRKLSTALKYGELLNKNYPGRFQVGDWVSHAEFGVNTLGEWEWVAQSDDAAYLV